MRFKQFINEEDNDKLIWDAYNRIESLVGYSCTFRYVAELDVKRLEIGHNYVKEYKKAIFDEVRPLLDKITVFTPEGEKMSLNKQITGFGEYLGHDGDSSENIERRLFTDGDGNFVGFLNMLIAKGVLKKDSWAGDVYDVLELPVYKAGAEYLLDYILQAMTEFKEWCDEVYDECRKANKKVFKSVSEKFSPVTMLISAISGVMTDTKGDPFGIRKRFFHTASPYRVEDYFYGPSKRMGAAIQKKNSGRFSLGDESVEFWADLINGFADKLEKISEKYSDLKAPDEGIVETCYDELEKKLKEFSLNGVSFVALPNPDYYKNPGKETPDLNLYEVNGKSDIEKVIKKFGPEAVSALKGYSDRVRNDSDDISSPWGWAKKFGTAHDF